MASFWNEKFQTGRRFSIARSQPKGMALQSISWMAPSPELLHWWKTSGGPLFWDEYQKRFIAELDESVSDFLANGEDKVDKCRQLAGGKEIYVLCCWEKTPAYCHRRLVAEYMRSKGITGGILVR